MHHDRSCFGDSEEISFDMGFITFSPDYSPVAHQSTRIAICDNIRRLRSDDVVPVFNEDTPISVAEIYIAFYNACKAIITDLTDGGIY
jgi:hypothetical protein